VKSKAIVPGVQHATVLISLTALIFFFFFQINKWGPLHEVNPFAEDPYDAVGSFAIQLALLVGLLNLARSLRLAGEPVQSAKTRLILRGNLLVLSAILFTLLSDAVAVTRHARLPSFVGNFWLIELGLMFLLAGICILALILKFWHLPTEIPPRDLTPADVIDDLWAIVRISATKLRTFLPEPAVEWVQRFNSDRLFAKAPWMNPRAHPWRFTCLVGFLVGNCLVLLQLQEGLPPDLQVGLLVAGIFIFGELIATLTGFAIFGGYLGLRPSLRT
jgi:hypothetical protein